jgi:pimeloyl-ACP methyl ester carboxylesterase
MTNIALASSGETVSSYNVDPEIDLNQGLNFEESVLKISDSRSVYYKHIKAQKNKPTLVLLNGLIYPLKNWYSYINLLANQGFGVVLISFSTQAESLRHVEGQAYYEKLSFSINGPKQYGLEISDLAEDVLKVTEALKIKKFHLQTLSFGSIVGSYIANYHQDKLSSLSMISPAVMSSHRYTPYGESRHMFYKWQNQINLNPFYDPNYFYDLELYQTMRMILESQRPTLDLEGTNFESVFNGVFQMARASKYFDLKDEALKKWPKFSLILASDEEAELQKDQLRFWSDKLRADKTSSLITIEGTPHAIPGVKPNALFQVTHRILSETNLTGEYTYSTESLSWSDGKKSVGNTPMCSLYLDSNHEAASTSGTSSPSSLSSWGSFFK